LDVNKYNLLKPEEERLLSSQALLGDKAAADRLVTSNLRFVIKIAKHYQDQGVPLEDLITEGNLGLITAVKKFDPTRKFKFITYASYWIRQGILKALGEQNRVIRVPTNKIALLSKVRKAIDTLTVKLERAPSHEEIDEYLDMKVPYQQLKSIEDRPFDLNASVVADNDVRTLKDILPDHNQPSPADLMRPEMLTEELELMFATLTKREKDIIYLYYGIGTGEQMTLEQLGHVYGLCRERIRQIKKTGLTKLRDHPNIERLREFL